MRLKVKRFEISAGRPVIFLHPSDAKRMDINVGDRVHVSAHGKSVIGIVDVLQEIIKSGEVSLSEDILEYLKVKPREIVDVKIAPRPPSAAYIVKKMEGKTLQKEEIRAIITDVITNALTEAEIAQFIVAVYEKGMSMEETIYLTEVMYTTGVVLHWHSPIIADKHCIGGVAGNRTTPLVVAICVAAGLVMPKTSSRAITSAAGTADTIETLTKVDFPAHELKQIVERVGGCLAWGGSLGMAPADDKLIKIERILRLDPDSQLIASILSKKLSAGSTHILIDIPYGRGAKVTRERGIELREKFLKVAQHFKLHIEVILTDGSQPIGNGIGPVLEMIDVLKVLKQKPDRPADLEKKSIMLAGILLELAEAAPKGKGQERAIELLKNGKALEKFEEIIRAQGANKTVLQPGKYKTTIHAKRDGIIAHIDNKAINNLAVTLGCPFDKESGIYLHSHAGCRIKRGLPLATLYSCSPDKLDEARRDWDHTNPIVIV